MAHYRSHGQDLEMTWWSGTSRSVCKNRMLHLGTNILPGICGRRKGSRIYIFFPTSCMAGGGGLREAGCGEMESEYKSDWGVVLPVKGRWAFWCEGSGCIKRLLIFNLDNPDVTLSSYPLYRCGAGSLADLPKTTVHISGRARIKIWES